MILSAAGVFVVVLVMFLIETFSMLLVVFHGFNRHFVGYYVLIFVHSS